MSLNDDDEIIITSTEDYSTTDSTTEPDSETTTSTLPITLPTTVGLHHASALINYKSENIEFLIHLFRLNPAVDQTLTFIKIITPSCS